MDTQTIISKVKSHEPKILGSGSFNKYAVLVPLMKKGDGIHLIFEVRSKSLRRQPGEICFPGGRIDKSDRSAKAAAIRETTEELGVLDQSISNVYPIDYLVSPFGMIVSPYVGVIEDMKALKPNPAEVGEVFTVPLAYFLDNKPQVHYVNLEVKPDDTFPFDLIEGGEDYDFRSFKLPEYFYVYEGKVIWGLTARIVAHFIDIIQD
ncbi:CoA pyrophosphatase [Aquibacillus koreensis]|uniref:CoA pyrophosphatase n=1 Tax=Aquibacillus koreensis TaxID=279446 RepID=A0A9X3WJ59_9BACI|nr:CoA pyrophosphatase [Aquibacillus koreensis]MCT2535143.1 CoA pyrophosphatase [Aquibacillus koreensis]MDC3421002.1 CoA pyrophosphatase [Aquibacillus koreensis]